MNMGSSKKRWMMVCLLCVMLFLSSHSVANAAWFGTKVYRVGYTTATAFAPYAVSAAGDSCHPSDPGDRWVYFRVSVFLTVSRFKISNYNILNDAHLAAKGGLDGAYEQNFITGYTTFKLCGKHEYGFDAWSYRLRYI